MPRFLFIFFVSLFLENPAKAQNANAHEHANFYGASAGQLKSLTSINLHYIRKIWGQPDSQMLPGYRGLKIELNSFNIPREIENASAEEDSFPGVIGITFAFIGENKLSERFASYISAGLETLSSKLIWKDGVSYGAVYSLGLKSQMWLEKDHNRFVFFEGVFHTLHNRADQIPGKPDPFYGLEFRMGLNHDFSF